MFLVRKDGAKTGDTPPRDHRMLKKLSVENECFVLSIIAIVLFVGYQYVAIISKKAHRTRQEGPKSRHRRNIADGCCNFTFAKVKNNTKNTFVKVNFVGFLGNQFRKYHNFFGVNSKKVMFWGGESLGYLSQNRSFFTEDLRIFCWRFEDFLTKI